MLYSLYGIFDRTDVKSIECLDRLECLEGLDSLERLDSLDFKLSQSWETLRKCLVLLTLRKFLNFRKVLLIKMKISLATPEKENFYLNGDDINLPCHSESQQRISQVNDTKVFEF